MAAPITVQPPDGQGGRRVVARGQILGVAPSAMDVLDLVQEAGWEREHVRLDDRAMIDWRRGGAREWEPRKG